MTFVYSQTISCTGGASSSRAGGFRDGGNLLGVAHWPEGLNAKAVTAERQGGSDPKKEEGQDRDGEQGRPVSKASQDSGVLVRLAHGLSHFPFSSRKESNEHYHMMTYYLRE